MKHLKNLLSQPSAGNASAAVVGQPSAHRRYSRLKHLAFMLLFLLGSLNVWGDPVVLNSVSTKEVTAQGNAGQNTSVSKEFSGVTCTVTKKSNNNNQPGFYTSSGIVRYYSGDEMTLSVASGNNITAITFVMNSGTVGTASVGTLSQNSLSWSGSAQSVTFTGGATVKITSISVTYSAGGGSEPSLSVSPTVIDFGTVDKDASVEAQEVTVTYENLTGAVAYSGLSGAFTASGTIAASGNKITITPNTANTGNFQQTLTVQSEADSKSAEVTVKMNVVEPFDGRKLTFDVSANPGGWPTTNSTTTTDYTYTLNEVDYTFALNNVKCNSGYLMLTSVAKLGLPAISGYKLVKVEATNSSSCSTSTQVSVSSSDAIKTDITGGAAQTWGTTSTKYTYNLSGTEENTMYYLWIANKNCQITELVLYYVEAEAAAVATPSISGEDNFLNSTEVSMTCATEGAAIYYTTTESAKATPATSGDWTAYDSENKPSFSATTTVWAAAKKDAAWSAVAEKTFTKATVLSVAEALAIINAWPSNQTSTQDYYVAGTVSTVTSLTVGGTGEYYISDDGTTTTQLQVYKGLWIGGVNFSSTDQLYVGDDVTLKGKLRKYSSYKELDQNNEVIAHKPIARLSWSDASYNAEIDGSNSFPTLTNTNSVSVTYSSSNTDAATINASTGAIELVVEGSTTITATFAGNETYKANSVSYTLNVAAAVIRADISFNVDGGTAVEGLTQQSNLPNPLPATSKAGKNFGGWYIDSEFNTPAVAGAAVASTDAITLYAKWLEPYTVAQALAMIDELEDGGYSATEVYVSGIVCTASTSLYSSKYLCYYISADGTEDTRLYVFDGLDENGAAFTDITDIQVLDEVVVYGKLQKYVKNDKITPEIAKDNIIYSLTHKQDAGIAWTADEAEATIGEENTFPNLTNVNAVAVTYSSSETDYATIDASTGEITLVAAGQTTITATFAGDATYKAASVSYTLTVKPVVVHGSITYEENGGETVNDVADATELPNPLPTTTKDGHKFLGWYTDSELTTPAVAGAALTGNTTLYAAWEEISDWAYEYRSNVTISSSESKKVIILEDEFDAAKANKGASATITLPLNTTKIHLHLVAWNGEAQTVTVTGDCFNESKELAIAADAGVSGSSNYTLAGNAYEYYFSLTPDNAVTENEVITITAASGKRFVLFGVNQEGGILPVLDHITITGTMTNTTGWKTGDNIVPEGLTVNAIYTLNEAEQEPINVTSDVVWSHEALVENQTEVTLTATYTDDEVQKTANVNVTIDAVETGESIISTDANNRYWTVDKDAVAEDKTFAVTLKNVASATATLGGTNPEAFNITPATLTADGDITVSVVSTATAGTYTATITISDDASVAEDKVVNVSLTVNEPEVPETAVSTTSEWIAAADADLVDGAQVLIAGVKDEVTYAMGQQNNNNRAAVAATVSEGVLTPGEGTMSFTLVAQDGGTFALRTSNGKYLYAASSGNNYMRTQDDIDENAKWTITATSASAKGSSNRHLMRFNASSILFSCYSSGQADIAFYVPKPAVTPEPVYTEVRNGLAVGRFYTICLNKEFSAVRGATLWDIENGNNDEITLIEAVLSGNNAGKPYIFLATATTMEVAYGENTTTTASSKNGLHGTFVTLTETELDGKYILSENQLWYVDVTGGSANVTLAPYRAYLNKSEVPDQSAEGDAPARRRMVMAINNPSHTPTGVDMVQTASEGVQKVVVDGNLYIVRDGRMYDTTGRLVK